MMKTPRQVARLPLRLSYSVIPELRCVQRYRVAHGRMPNLVKPKTLNEKILRKMLFDRNPNLTLFADKALVRGLVESRLGAGEHLTKMYGVVESGTDVLSLSLPNRFVMKPTHLSGEIMIVRDSKTLALGELEKVADRWLRLNLFDRFNEWAYRNIKPRVILEELLEDEGRIPPDYKFFCFHGEPRFFYVTRGRFEKELTINFYDLDLNLLPVKLTAYENFQEPLSPPKDFGKMIEIARRLSAGTDFIRVDLYNIEGRIVFGELTNYPMHATGTFEPPSWDTGFGRYW